MPVKNLIRKNVSMSPALAKWYEEKAKEMGVSQSALMVVAMQRYYEGQKALELGAQVPQLLEVIEELKKATNPAQGS